MESFSCNLFFVQDISQTKRQEFLKQYFHFDCHCIPCSFNWPLQRDIKTSVAKRGMGDKANEIKFAYANVSKLTMHDMQVTKSQFLYQTEFPHNLIKGSY